MINIFKSSSTVTVSTSVDHNLPLQRPFSVLLSLSASLSVDDFIGEDVVFRSIFMLKLPTISPTRVRSPGSSPDVERRKQQRIKERISLPMLPRIVSSMGNIASAAAGKSREVSPESESKVTDVKTFLLTTAAEQKRRNKHWRGRVNSLTAKPSTASENPKLSPTASKYLLDNTGSDKKHMSRTDSSKTATFECLPSKEVADSNITLASVLSNSNKDPSSVNEERRESFRTKRISKSLSADNVFTLTIYDDELI